MILYKKDIWKFIKRKKKDENEGNQQFEGKVSQDISGNIKMFQKEVSIGG